MHSTEIMCQAVHSKNIASIARTGLGQEDRLHGILNKLYPNSLIHGLGESLEKEKLGENPILLTSSKSLSVLNIIKYK